MSGASHVLAAESAVGEAIADDIDDDGWNQGMDPENPEQTRPKGVWVHFETRHGRDLVGCHWGQRWAIRLAV